MQDVAKVLDISLGDCKVGIRRKEVEQEKRRKKEVKQEEKQEEEIKERELIEWGNIKVGKKTAKRKKNLNVLNVTRN